MSLENVNDGSTCWLTITFLDQDGVAASPSSATYRIDDPDTGVEIVDDTAITPISSEVELEISPESNTVRSESNVRERRRVTVKATFGSGDKFNKTYTYNVVNLTAVTV